MTAVNIRGNHLEEHQILLTRQERAGLKPLSNLLKNTGKMVGYLKTEDSCNTMSPHRLIRLELVNDFKIWLKSSL